MMPQRLKMGCCWACKPLRRHWKHCRRTPQGVRSRLL
jgi:hypothetical protein